MIEVTKGAGPQLLKNNDDNDDEPLNLYLSHVNNNNQVNQVQKRPIEEEFDIIEDAGDQALISYYNDSPTSPDRVSMTDRLKQITTNLGYMISHNGSKKVDLTSNMNTASIMAESMSYQMNYPTSYSVI